MTSEELLARFRELNRAFETKGSEHWEDNEWLHGAMDALLLQFAGAEVEAEFDKHTKWYS